MKPVLPFQSSNDGESAAYVTPNPTFVNEPTEKPEYARLRPISGAGLEVSITDQT